MAGSANLLGYAIAYAEDTIPPREWPQSTISSIPISSRHLSKDPTRTFSCETSTDAFPTTVRGDEENGAK